MLLLTRVSPVGYAPGYTALAIDRLEQVTDCVLNFEKITCREF